MTKQLASASIAITGKSSKFERTMNRTAKKLNRMEAGIRRNDRRMKSFNNTMKGTVRTLGAMAAGFVGVAGARFLRDKIREVADFAAGVYESSIRLGVNTKFLQAWQRAFEGESGSIQGADKALEKFTRAVGESRSEIRKGAFDTGSYSEVFKQLGISADQVRESNMEELLGLVAKGMKNTADQTDVAAYGLELFGSRGKSAINVLMDGMTEFEDKLERFKALGTLELVESQKLKDVSQAFTDVGTVVQYVWQTIIARYSKQIVKALEDKIETIKKIPAAFDEFLKILPKIRSFAVAIGVLFGTKLVVAFGLATAAIIKTKLALLTLRGALIKTGIGALIVALGTGIYYFDQLVQSAGGFKNAMFTVWEAIKQVFKKAWSAVKAYMYGQQYVWKVISAYITAAMADGLKAILDLINDARRHFAGLKEGIKALFLNIGDIIKGVFVDSGKSAAEVFQEGYQKGFDSIEEVGTSAFKALEGKALEFAESANKSFNSMKEAWGEVTDAFEFTHFPNTSQFSSGPRNRGQLGAETRLSNRANAGAGNVGGAGGGNTGVADIVPERFEAVGIPRIRPDTVEWMEFKERLKDMTTDFSKGIADMGRSMTDFWENGEFNAEKFREKGRSIAKSVADSFANKAIWEPFEKLLDSIFKGAAGAATGGSFKSNFIQALTGRAGGGPVSSGKPYLVGERGPEVIMPKRAGYVHNNRNTAGMLGGGGMTFAPTITTDNPQLIRAILRQEAPRIMQMTEDRMNYRANQPGRTRTNLGGA